jgi:hypothetical protein
MSTPAFTPRWQIISGLTPQESREMTDAQRDQSLRTLFKEVVAMARAEFRRETPAYERSYLWDPIERICHKLDIARLKLSRLCRELTGMRVFDLSDKLKAEGLANYIRHTVKAILARRDKDMRAQTTQYSYAKESLYIHWSDAVLQELREARQGSTLAVFASQRGFANVPRMRKGCMLNFGCTLEDLEKNLVRTMVQKFFEDAAEELGLKKPWNRDDATDADLIPGSLIPVYFWKAHFESLPADAAEARRILEEYLSEHTGATKLKALM